MSRAPRRWSTRLPISIRIEGPQVQLGFASRQRAAGAASDRARQRLAAARSTADGHRVSFGLGTLPWQREPHGIGWITLALLLG